MLAVFPRPSSARTATRPPLRSCALGLLGTVLTLGGVGLVGAPVSVAEPTPSGGASTAAPQTTITGLAIPTATSAERSTGRRVLAQQRAATTTAERPGSNLLASLPEQRTARFSTIGVTWTPTRSTTPASAVVQVRTHAVDGAWTDWAVLDDESDDSPAGATRVGTAPVYVGESDGVEVRVSSDTASTALPGLQVSLIDSPEVAADANPELASAQTSAQTSASPSAATPTLPALAPQPRVISRRGWGANESWRSINGADCAVPKIDDTIFGAVLHHTAGSNSYSSSQTPSIVRGVYAYHTKTQGWCDIGYNFLVNKYGQIYEGRAGGINVPVHGAHATSWNTNTVGVSMIGDYDKVKPSAAMLNSVTSLVAWKLEGYYRNPKGTVTLAGKKVNVIFGHGDVMSTACPGRYIRAQYTAIRQQVATKIGSYGSPVYQRWQAMGADNSILGSPHVGEIAVGRGRVTQFDRGATMLYHPYTGGTFWVAGKIRTKWLATGGTASPLGWPITDEVAGRSAGSRASTFQNAKIYYSPSTGAVPVSGAIRTGYTRLGEDTSWLGLPTADQVSGPVAGGTSQRFVNGWLTYSAGTGLQPMQGAIGTRWASLSTANQSLIGFPTAAQSAVAADPSVARQTFTNGLIFSDARRTYVLHSDILSAYTALGAETSRLGLPTSDVHGITGGSEALFQGGRIVWDAATDRTQVIYA